MNAPRLNLDVLSVVCSFLADVADFLSFSLTCSSLHPIAMGWLLRTRCIHLKDDVMIQKFHFFLFADAPARTPHVRAFRIVVGKQRTDKPADLSIPGHDVLRIVDILTSCPHVETITLFLDDSHLGHDHNRPIVGAIAGMQSLRALRIQGAPNDALTLLRDVQSPLRKLDIQSHSARNFGSRFWTPRALEDILPHLALTLEDLGITGLVVDPEFVQCRPRITMPPVSTMTQYAAVRSLTVRLCLGKLFLDQLQHLFPALDGTLALHRSNMLRTPSEDVYADIRATNWLAQETYASGPCSRGWRSLDRVICPAPMLYMLGLRCAIRLVRLHQCTFDTMHYAVDALRENPIPRLALSLPLGEELRGLDTLCSPELAGSLTHLTLRLAYTHEDGLGTDPGALIVARFPWSHFLAKLVSTLRPLHRLTHLRIAIVSNVRYPSYAAMMRSDEFMRTAHGSSFDFDGTATSCISLLPTLRCLFIETRGTLTITDSDRGIHGSEKHEDWHIPRGWRVTEPGTNGAHDGGEPALVELTDAVMERMIRNEELVLSDDEQVPRASTGTVITMG
ncbi:hypothetical protein V8D89_014319 [Ganoderma adspersum]